MPPPYAAYLRVYEPLAAFTPAERVHWRGYAEGGDVPDRATGPHQENQESVRRLVAPVRGADDHAFLVEVDGAVLVCPWGTALRSWETVLAVRGSLPELVADALVPAGVAETARASSEAWRAEHPAGRPHIRSSGWSVPVHWFLVFDEQSRLMGGEDEEIVYRTSMADARRRCARSLAVLRKTHVDDEQARLLVEDLAQAVEDCGRWLEDFHPHALVELDYGGLAPLLAAEERVADRSVADIHAALAALARTDLTAATAAYGRVAERWRRTQLAESLN